MITLEYLRHFRIFDFAIFDLFLSFLGMYLLSGPLSKLSLKIKIIIPQKTWVYWTLPIGILIHLAFGQITPMAKYFIDFHGHYILKIVILIFIILGARGIRKA